MSLTNAPATTPAPKVITPTIGRRLWYWPSDYDKGLVPGTQLDRTICVGDDAQACDAGVVFVHGDRLVNLLVTDHAGHTHRRLSVHLVQEGDEPLPPGAAYAQWMPYQQGQAKKDSQPLAASQGAGTLVGSAPLVNAVASTHTPDPSPAAITAAS